jgi:transcriptional regulator with XRE-family HTH domain
MYLRGMYQADIAKKLGVNQSAISRDLSALRKQWMEQSVGMIDQKKALELAKLDRLEITYWEAWENSKRNSEIEVTEQIGSRDKKGKTEQIIPERVKKTKRVEGQSGNPAFLSGVLNCINKRCEILGLNAPSRNMNIDMSLLTDEQLSRIAQGEDIFSVLINPGLPKTD